MSTVAESSIFAAPEAADTGGGWPMSEDVFAEDPSQSDEHAWLGEDADTEFPDETGWQTEDSDTEWTEYTGGEYLDETGEGYLDETDADEDEYDETNFDETSVEEADYLEDVDESEEAGEVEEAEADEYDEYEEFDETLTDEETFPSGVVLTARPGPTGPGEEHYDPNKTGLPLYDTGPDVRAKKLSANFTVGELVTSGGRPADRARISPALVACLQAIRDRSGRPVKITSGYRSWARNTALYRARGKKPTDSRHCSGQAADITITGLTGMQIAKLAIDAYGANIGIGIGKNFAHIDVRGRPDTWTYFTGKQDTYARNEINNYRTNRTTPTPPPQPTPTPRPTPTPTPTSDRAAGIVRRGAFKQCTGKEQRGARAMKDQWTRLTGRKAGTYNCRSTTFGTPSLHGEGRSIDLYAEASKDAQRAQAEAYVAWLQANAVELQVAFIIWNRKQWSWKSRASGWRPYPGSNPHTDHIHVDLSWEGALTPSPLFSGPVPGVGSSVAPTPPDKSDVCPGCSKPPPPKPSGKVPSHVAAFVRRYRSEAQASEARSRIPWLVTLGQAALESGWGRRTCANNLFGIKAKASMPESKRKLCTTKEVHKSPNVSGYPEIISVTQRTDGRYDYVVRAWFRAFASPSDSFDDHTKVLGLPRYAKAFAHTDDPYAFAREVAAGGYATAPNYAAELTGVMKLIEKVPQ